MSEEIQSYFERFFKLYFYVSNFLKPYSIKNKQFKTVMHQVQSYNVQYVKVLSSKEFQSRSILSPFFSMDFVPKKDRKQFVLLK